MDSELKYLHVFFFQEKINFNFRHSKEQWTDLVNLPNDQKSIYVGPLEDHTKESDLQAQFVQFGAIRVIS